MTLLQRRIRETFELVRAADWWQYKLAPAMAIFVATAVVQGRPLAMVWPRALALLGGLAVCAAYVSLINDLTDLRDDVAAGKPNRQIGRGRRRVIGLVALTICAGLAMLWSWRSEPLLAGAYAGSWLVFTLYSLSPFRLKARGLAGVLCDAAGAHLFPALAAVFAACGPARPDLAWTVTVAVLAFSYGLRGILFHQLADGVADARSGVRTFAVRSRVASIRLGELVIFPAELCALAVMLSRIAQPLPVLALGWYVLLLFARDRAGRVLTVVRPAPTCERLMEEYYGVLLPMSCLLGGACADWRATVFVAAFAALFPTGVVRAVHESAQQVRAIVRVTARAVIPAFKPSA